MPEYRLKTMHAVRVRNFIGVTFAAHGTSNLPRIADPGKKAGKAPEAAVSSRIPGRTT